MHICINLYLTYNNLYLFSTFYIFIFSKMHFHMNFNQRHLDLTTIFVRLNHQIYVYSIKLTIQLHRYSTNYSTLIVHSYLTYLLHMQRLEISRNLHSTKSPSLPFLLVPSLVKKQDAMPTQSQSTFDQTQQATCTLSRNRCYVLRWP